MFCSIRAGQESCGPAFQGRANPAPGLGRPGHKPFARLRLIGMVFLLALLNGCGGSKSGETVVRGQILYRGEPIGGGLVVFAPNPDRGSDGPVITASLQNDGSFTLTAPDGKPVPAGWYRISVAPKAGSVDAPTAERPYPGLPAKYRNPGLSGLEREIKVGTDNVFCFDLDDA